MHSETYNEEYITKNADSFDWDDFECSMNVFSKKFKSEIRIRFWKNEKGLLHREDGPALIDKRLGQKVWYINGDEMSNKTVRFLKQAKKQKFKTLKDKESWYLKNMFKIKYQEEKFQLIHGFSRDFFINVKDEIEMGELFMWAAEQGNNYLVEILANILGVDYKAYVGSTALMMAAGSDRKETVNLLINLGANINEKDKYDRTALMFCRFFQKKEMYDFIKNHKDYIDS